MFEGRSSGTPLASILLGAVLMMVHAQADTTVIASTSHKLVSAAHHTLDETVDIILDQFYPPSQREIVLRDLRFKYRFADLTTEEMMTLFLEGEITLRGYLYIDQYKTQIEGPLRVRVQAFNRDTSDVELSIRFDDNPSRGYLGRGRAEGYELTARYHIAQDDPNRHFSAGKPRYLYLVAEDQGYTGYQQVDLWINPVMLAWKI